MRPESLLQAHPPQHKAPGTLQVDPCTDLTGLVSESPGQQVLQWLQLWGSHLYHLQRPDRRERPPSTTRSQILWRETWSGTMWEGWWRGLGPAFVSGKFQSSDKVLRNISSGSPWFPLRCTFKISGTKVSLTVGARQWSWQRCHFCTRPDNFCS